MKRRQLNIKDYVKNASKNLSMTRLVIYAVVSIILAVLLIISAVQSHYQGSALLFTVIVFTLIAGYAVLNILSIIKKIQDN